LEYADIIAKFRIDEDMYSYFEIFDWMVSVGFPVNFASPGSVSITSTAGLGEFSDATLTILNSRTEPKIRVSFLDVYPNLLDVVPFDAQAADVNYVECNVTFKTRQFTYARI